MRSTVIYQSSDFDGIFCREIVRHFIGDRDIEYIGWNFGDKTIEVPKEQLVYVLDLPLDRPLGFVFMPPESDAVFNSKNIIWIDHHKSSIESHPNDIPGYRIDGVAACRLAWQWFNLPLKSWRGFNKPPEPTRLPEKQDFIDRKVSEPLAVRLAGEYAVEDLRDERSQKLHFGLQSCEPIFNFLLSNDEEHLWRILTDGAVIQRYVQRMYLTSPQSPVGALPGR